MWHVGKIGVSHVSGVWMRGQYSEMRVVCCNKPDKEATMAGLEPAERERSYVEGCLLCPLESPAHMDGYNYDPPTLPTSTFKIRKLEWTETLLGG